MAYNSKTLTGIGLEDAASWKLADGSLKTVGDKRARWRWLTARRSILYVFCSGAKLLYVGRAIGTLSKRFAGLQPPVLGSPNETLHRAILRLLKSGKEVRIQVLADVPSLYWGGFAIDLAASIEASLVAFLQPPWNKDPSRRLAAASRKRDVAGD